MTDFLRRLSGVILWLAVITAALAVMGMLLEVVFLVRPLFLEGVVVLGSALATAMFCGIVWLLTEVIQQLSELRSALRDVADRLNKPELAQDNPIGGTPNGEKL